MASYDELILTYRLFMKAYPFRRYAIHPTPCSPLKKPLHQARIALVTTAGLHTPEQPGFDFTSKQGDCAFREIPGNVETPTLLESHRSDSFDHAGIEADRNLAFPLDRFRELVASGIIGTLNHRHFSFMGSIVRPQMLIEETAPQVARMLRDDKVDAALLTPVWPMCVQTVGLLQAEIERAGITTVSISLLHEITDVIRPPRALFVPYRLGFPLGEPNNADLQHRVIAAALALLTRTDLPVIEDFNETA